MAGGKQTPRQKLIGLMYLIFLALMALNVSVEVLDSFPLINRGIEETNRNFEMKVDMVYTDFDAQKAIHGETIVQPYYDQAKHIKTLADSLVDYIRYNRALMIKQLNDIDIEEASTLDLHDLRRKDDYSFSSRFWLIENSLDPTDRGGGRGTRAYVLKEMIIDFKEQIESILELHEQSIKLALDVEGAFEKGDRKEVSWQEFTFDRVINIATATNLNRIITEIRNAEFDATSMLFDLIHAGDFRFDQVEAKVVPQREIVMVGGRYQADVFVAAIDTRQDPVITVDGRPIRVTDGVGRIDVPATRPGQHTIRGNIEVVTPAGVRSTYPFSAPYTVETPRATVSATNMNVFYSGLDNPVSISAPGVSAGNLRPVIASGQADLRRDPSGTGYIVEPKSLDDIVIAVNAVIDGQSQKLDEMLFRVRQVPRPEPKIGGHEGGRLPREALIRAARITADMGADFHFAGVEWNVISFEMITIVGGEVRSERQDNGSSLTPAMINYLNTARPNQIFNFNNIRARGPGEETRTIGSLSFNVN